MDCIDNIIGLSENNCPCLPDKLNNIIQNGTFDTDLSQWVNNGTWQWIGGKASESTTGNTSLDQEVVLIVGHEYTLSFDVDGLRSCHVVGFSSGYEFDLVDGNNTFTFVATEENMTIRFIDYLNGNTVTVDNVLLTADDFDTSLSGLYIDDKSNQGIKIKGLMDTRNCEQTTELWNTLGSIRSQAIKNFKEGFFAMLSNLKVKQYHRTSYKIGDMKKGTGALTASQYPFAIITPEKTFTGQEVHLNSVKLQFSSSYTDTIPFYIFADGELLESKYMNMVAGVGEVVFNTVLPVVNKYNDVVDYKLVYDRKSGFPMDYKWNCKCGSSKRAWQNYWNMSAGSVSDLSNLEDATVQYKNSMGMQISASIECNPLNFLCDLDYATDYGVPATIAKTIQLMSWKILANYLLRSNKVDIWSLCKSEELKANIVTYNEEIDWRFRWLVQEYNYSYSDCYLCSDSQNTRLVDIGG